jgi:hypothetical protein
MIERADGAPEIRLTQLAKHFRDVRAVDRVSLDIGSGEFFSLLGPSGCGKTTTLRMIGGFELPTAGRIELPGRDVTLDPPDKRPVNMVFQNYALSPISTSPRTSPSDSAAHGLRLQRPPPTAHGLRLQRPPPIAHRPTSANASEEVINGSSGACSRSFREAVSLRGLIRCHNAPERALELP